MPRILCPIEALLVVRNLGDAGSLWRHNQLLFQVLKRLCSSARFANRDLTGRVHGGVVWFMIKFHLRRRVRNAWLAFHPGEANYRMNIRSIRPFTVAYRGGTADESVLAHSFDHDIFFAGVPELNPGNDAVFIDIGAHIGTFSLFSASKAKAGRVYAIEASRETFNYLKVNAALNPDLPISVFHLAMADHDGEVTLHHDRKNWGHTITKKLSAAGERVEAMTLTTFIQTQKIEHVDFIKFNCEGAEFQILMSTPVETLRKFEMMLVLYHLDLVNDYSLADLLDKLAAAGFTTSVRNQEQGRGWVLAQR